MNEIVKNPLIEKSNNEEANMADTKDTKEQDLVENPKSGLGESASAEDIKASGNYKSEAGGESLHEEGQGTDEAITGENSADPDESEIPPPVKKAKRKASSDKNQVTILPANVTLEPRNPEEMDITPIQDSKTMLDVYLNVSDDSGQMHGDLELEKAIMEFNLRHMNISVATIVDAKKLLEESTELINRYAPVLGRSSHIAAGIMTKYAIRLGMVFNIQKIATRKLCLHWTDWFKKNHPLMSLRSAQDYMALARVPGIIKYAFLGKERLLEILRGINDLKGEDPFQKYIENRGITFNHEQLTYDGIKDIKKDVDAVIALSKIEKAEQEKNIKLDVNENIVKTLINMGIEFNNALIEKLFLLREYTPDCDVNQYLVDVIQKKGPENSSIDKDKKIRNIPKLIGMLKSTIKFITDETDYRNHINDSMLEELQDSIEKLKTLIQTN